VFLNKRLQITGIQQNIAKNGEPERGFRYQGCGKFKRRLGGALATAKSKMF